MPSSFSLSSIVAPLLAWYQDNRRPLPWRRDSDPYHIWLSEIMLQQTRIEAVIPYYERFLAAYPTVHDLAEADDEQLMKLWQGLGYYSRARHLKAAARRIVQEHGGTLPADYTALRALPGIGDYTAGAIASIAYGLPEPAVDGNVLRVITRLGADERDILQNATRRDITAALRDIYPTAPAEASALTQALMELGEQICLPNGTPNCAACPLGAACQARARNLVDRIPVRAPKKPRRIEKRTVFVLVCGGKIALCKRPDKGLLSGLWEFPSLPAAVDAEQAGAHLSAQGEMLDMRPLPEAVHIFTHIEWHMQGYLARLSTFLDTWDGAPLVWVTPRELTERYAVPTAYRVYLNIATALDKDTPDML